MPFQIKEPTLQRLAFLSLLCISLPLMSQPENQAAVSALGRIEPQGGVIKLGVGSTPEATTGSILAELLVKEGDYVEAGQLLAVTDSAKVVKALVHKARSELEQAIRASDAAHSKADATCVLADVAAREAGRRADLLSRNLASEEETEQAQGVAEAGAASCTAARSTARVAESAIEVARSQLSLQEMRYERTQLRAPVAGRILHIVTQPGEFIARSGVLELGMVGRMVAIAEVYETDINRVQIGQRAIASSEALAEPLGGKVTFIALKVHKQDEIGTDPAARKDARIIEVEILLDDPQAAETLTNLQVEIIINP